MKKVEISLSLILIMFVLFSGCIQEHRNGPWAGDKNFAGSKFADMNNGPFAKIKSDLGLPEDASEEQIKTALGLSADASQQQMMQAIQEKFGFEGKNKPFGGIQNE